MTVSRACAAIPRTCLHLAQTAGMSFMFLAESLLYGCIPPFRFRRILDQIVFVGVGSIPIIVLTGIFTGMVLGLQGYHNLRNIGQAGMLGSLVALSIIRELGPVLSALVVTGRAGSSMTAEIGIMKLTEQLSALEMMAVNPVKYVVTPKIIAGAIALPVLTLVFDVVGILGGYIVGVWLLGVNQGSYLGGMMRAAGVGDILGSLLKSLVFGLVMSWVCSLVGYRAKTTAEGIAAATTNAVVITTVTVLILDYMLTSLLL